MGRKSCEPPLRYDLYKPIKQQAAEFTVRFRDLAVMNKELGIQGLHQNHRGRDFFGRPIWDMGDPFARKLVSKMLPKEIPVSIHIEYVRGPDVASRTVAAMKNDLATVRKWPA